MVTKINNVTAEVDQLRECLDAMAAELATYVDTVATLQEELVLADGRLAELRLSSLCRECAADFNRRRHGGWHCRWCGKPLVAKIEEEGKV